MPAAAAARDRTVWTARVCGRMGSVSFAGGMGPSAALSPAYACRTRLTTNGTHTLTHALAPPAGVPDAHRGRPRYRPPSCGVLLPVWVAGPAAGARPTADHSLGEGQLGYALGQFQVQQPPVRGGQPSVGHAHSREWQRLE